MANGNNRRRVLDSLSSNVIKAEYAVRGQIPLRGEEITKMIKTEGGRTHYQFENTTALNIGNPQKVGQGTITFNREVMAGCIYRPLLQTNAISEDAIKRCHKIKENWRSPVGAYTQNSKGGVYFRKTVADFINRRDGIDDSHEDKIFMCNGASEAVRLTKASVIRN